MDFSIRPWVHGANVIDRYMASFRRHLQLHRHRNIPLCMTCLGYKDNVTNAFPRLENSDGRLDIQRNIAHVRCA